MQIISLEAENVLGLKAIKLEVQGQSLVVVGGDNAQGKTDAINCFAFALGGKALCPEQPIREGQDEAHVNLTLDEFVVKRTWKRGRDNAIKTTLVITSPNGGVSVNRPQEMLDRLIGPLAFDPSAFARMKPADQADTLRRLVGLDFAALNAEYQQTYDQRRDVGRDLKALEARLAALPWHEIQLAEPVSTDDLATQLDEIQKYNTTIVEKQSMRNQLLNHINELTVAVADIESEITKLTVRLAATTKRLAEVKQSLTAADEWLAEHPLRETAEVRDKIKHADESNRDVRENAEHARVASERDACQSRHDDLEHKLRGIVNTKARLIAKATMPIAGLGLNDSGVTYLGRPFDQASGSERLLIATAIGLALAPKKHGLRLLLMRDPAWLDGANLARVRDMAKVNDALIVLERGGTGPECTVIIKNGEVKNRSCPTSPS